MGQLLVIVILVVIRDDIHMTSTLRGGGGGEVRQKLNATGRRNNMNIRLIYY